MPKKYAKSRKAMSVIMVMIMILQMLYINPASAQTAIPAYK